MATDLHHPFGILVFNRRPATVSKWRSNYGWKWPLYTVVWGSATVLAVAAIIVGVILYDNYKEARGRGDAPVTREAERPWKVINGPDQFHNIAFICHGTNGLYTHTREAQPVVVPNDPMCAEGR
jgi:hypothetical protein